jgi:hypothetical protein
VNQFAKSSAAVLNPERDTDPRARIELLGTLDALRSRRDEVAAVNRDLMRSGTGPFLHSAAHREKISLADAQFPVNRLGHAGSAALCKAGPELSSLKNVFATYADSGAVLEQLRVADVFRSPRAQVATVGRDFLQAGPGPFLDPAAQGEQAQLSDAQFPINRLAHAGSAVLRMAGLEKETR